MNPYTAYKVANNITCLAMLATANVRGTVRAPFIIGTLVVGLNLGTLFRMCTYRLPHQFGSFSHRVSFHMSCVIVKTSGLALYTYWVIAQNRKRQKLVRELGISEEDSGAFNSIAVSREMTDIENIHFRYGY